jgi:protein TonB
MAVAGQESADKVAALEAFDALGGLFAPQGPRKRSGLVGTGVALAIHVGVAVGLVQVDTIRLFEKEKIVEMEVREPPPPPPEVRPEPPPPEPPPPEPKPRIVMKRAPAPVPTPTQEAPPPPNEAPQAEQAPPSFGVTMSSVVAGDGPGMAVPVGNTLMTKPTKRAPAGPPPPPAGDPNGLPPAVPEIFVAEQPKVLKEVMAEFPSDVARMGIEGRVVAKLYIDDNGNVRLVKIVQRAGHGLDELARDALKQYKFSPARTSDGKAVPTYITFTYVFEQPQ